MATFDVRDKGETVDKIVFWSGVGNYANEIAEFEGEGISIYDRSGEHVVVQDKHHALDMIKALEKAIELKWLK